MKVNLRPANKDDVFSVFNWRNDDWIVSLSNSQRKVSWEEHQKWFNSILENNAHLLYIIENDNGQGLGTIRFDNEDESVAVVSIYLLNKYTGKGIGTGVLRRGCKLAFVHWPLLQNIYAHIRADNMASIKSFGKAGFRFLSSENNQVKMVLMRRES